MSGRLAGALTGIAIVAAISLAAAQPAPAAPQPFGIPHPAGPFRDVVLKSQGAAGASISAAAVSERYSVHDPLGRTVAIGVTKACRRTCTSADPQQIADFLGTLLHRNEISLLTVELDTPDQIAGHCGVGAQACYISGQNRMIISGFDTPAHDGASREFVIAHEYGHHIAQHRALPAPFSPGIDWGTERWLSYERICQGERRGRFFPGDEGDHYFMDPGEAFAESYAFNRFPNAGVKWAWVDSLRPDANAFAAIHQDVRSPWDGRRTIVINGRLPSRGPRSVVRMVPTPLDGNVSVSLTGPVGSTVRFLPQRRSRHRPGRARSSQAGHKAVYTNCGRALLPIVVRRAGRHGGLFTLTVQVP